MIVWRPIRDTDLDDLVALARCASFGLTTLPPERDVLESRIAASVEAFARRAGKPGDETYLFGLEDEGEVIGLSGIVAKVGGFDPWYAYRRRTQVHRSETLMVEKTLDILELVREHSGPTEIGSLFAHPNRRRRGIGRLLSSARFLFIGEHRGCFEDQVIAEMRGIVDDRGYAPFWEAVGRHFFDMDFPDADYLSMREKHFIAELMPEIPIYVDLLPYSAQEVIGKVHPRTEPALRMLRSQGFVATDLVDIFEAGPVVRAETDAIATVRRRRRTVVASIDDPGEVDPVLVANCDWAMRATIAPVAVDDDGATVAGEVADALRLGPGDPLAVAPLR